MEVEFEKMFLSFFEIYVIVCEVFIDFFFELKIGILYEFYI